MNQSPDPTPSALDYEPGQYKRARGCAPPNQSENDDFLIIILTRDEATWLAEYLENQENRWIPQELVRTKLNDALEAALHGAPE